MNRVNRWHRLKCLIGASLAKAIGRTRLALVALVITALFVSAIAGTIVYYKSSPQNHASLSLVTTFLNIVERPNNSDLMQMFPELNPTYRPDCFWINGLVINNGTKTAYNTGLKVIAYDAKGTLQINMTFPLSGGAYGVDNVTNAFVLSNHRIGTYTKFDSSPWTVYNIGSLELGSLNGGQTANVTLAIFHEGTVTTWNVTPVWTTRP